MKSSFLYLSELGASKKADVISTIPDIKTVLTADAEYHFDAGGTDVEEQSSDWEIDRSATLKLSSKTTWIVKKGDYVYLFFFVLATVFNRSIAKALIEADLTISPQFIGILSFVFSALLIYIVDLGISQVTAMYLCRQYSKPKKIEIDRFIAQRAPKYAAKGTFVLPTSGFKSAKLEAARSVEDEINAAKYEGMKNAFDHSTGKVFNNRYQICLIFIVSLLLLYFLGEGARHFSDTVFVENFEEISTAIANVVLAFALNVISGVSKGALKTYPNYKREAKKDIERNRKHLSRNRNFNGRVRAADEIAEKIDSLQDISQPKTRNFLRKQYRFLCVLYDIKHFDTVYESEKEEVKHNAAFSRSNFMQQGKSHRRIQKSPSYREIMSALIKDIHTKARELRKDINDEFLSDPELYQRLDRELSALEANLKEDSIKILCGGEFKKARDLSRQFKEQIKHCEISHEEAKDQAFNLQNISGIDTELRSLEYDIESCKKQLEICDDFDEVHQLNNIDAEAFGGMTDTSFQGIVSQKRLELDTRLEALRKEFKLKVIKSNYEKQSAKLLNEYNERKKTLDQEQKRIEGIAMDQEEKIALLGVNKGKQAGLMKDLRNDRAMLIDSTIKELEVAYECSYLENNCPDYVVSFINKIKPATQAPTVDVVSPMWT